MSLEEQQKLIADIFTTGVPISLIGGIAVDILIDDRLDRVHKDFDGLALANDLPIISSKLENIGLTVKVVEGTTRKIEISKYGALVGAVGLADLDTQDNPFLVIVLSNGEKYELHYTAGFFGQRHPIPGGEAKVVSPLGLLQTLNTNLAINKPMRNKDIVSRELIVDRYFPGQPADSPRFIPVVVKP